MEDGFDSWTPPSYDEFCRDLDAWMLTKHELCRAAMIEINGPRMSEREMLAQFLVAPGAETEACSFFPTVKKAVGAWDWFRPLLCDPCELLQEEKDGEEEQAAAGTILVQHDALSWELFPRDVKGLIVKKLNARTLFMFLQASRDCHELATREIHSRVNRTPAEWLEIRKLQPLEKQWMSAVRKAQHLVEHWVSLYSETAELIFAREQHVSSLKSMHAMLNDIDENVVDVAKRLFKEAASQWVRPPRVEIQELACRAKLQDLEALRYGFDERVSFDQVRLGLERMTQEIVQLVPGIERQVEVQKKCLMEVQMICEPIKSSLFQLQKCQDSWLNSFLRVLERLHSSSQGILEASSDDWTRLLSLREKRVYHVLWNWHYTHSEYVPLTTLQFPQALMVFYAHENAVKYRHVLLRRPVAIEPPHTSSF